MGCITQTLQSTQHWQVRKRDHRVVQILGKNSKWSSFSFFFLFRGSFIHSQTVYLLVVNPFSCFFFLHRKFWRLHPHHLGDLLYEDRSILSSLARSFILGSISLCLSFFGPLVLNLSRLFQWFSFSLSALTFLSLSLPPFLSLSPFPDLMLTRCMFIFILYFLDMRWSILWLLV